ncbi:Zinc-regulated transporter 1 [Termitomyces sp. T112]|nr:Zinc-regulated transporter 1 [Termitomyces sp. T112]KAH0583309.1 hypothetical protein H2248_011177 [Termitomyces sp. 'cryptogamus']KNZ79482.1 Zinc-regulated transporter 1 [Termitomyces sp. J132]
MSDDTDCGLSAGPDTLLGLRIASVFIVLATSTIGALFPVLSKQSSWVHVPMVIYDFAKYFGSGVIIATAFIHLLDSSLEELGSPCLSKAWRIYPYALALCMLSIFLIFIVELVAFRWGMSKIKQLGIAYDTHGHDIVTNDANGPQPTDEPTPDPLSAREKNNGKGDLESQDSNAQGIIDNAAAQIIGVAILEFGILLHSVIIGLTLAVNEEFKVLFIVIIFHQTFEGLGVGSRLAYMKLHPKYDWTRIIGALLYGITTPVGIAAGLGVRTTYNPNSTTALIVSGVLDSLSAGILVYTGLVELLAHELLFNKEMITASNFKLAFAITSMFAGWGIMSLLGRWA